MAKRRKEENVPIEMIGLVSDQKTKKPNTYWEKAERLYRMAFRVILCVLPVFVIVFVAVCSRAFTYESIYCFFKDLGATGSFVNADYQSVSYTYEEGERSIVSYRGGVAVVGHNGVEVYSPSGEILLVKEATMKAPRAVASRKFLVAYDCGEKGFTVTNTYARVHQGETEFPVYMAEVADTGHFALVTPSDDDLSHVYLYNENCKLIHCFETTYAVTGVAISENGSHIALLGLASKQGNVFSVMEVYRIGDTTPATTVMLEGEAPLAVDFTNNRNLSVLTDTALRVFSLSGEERNCTAFSGAIVAFDSNEHGTAVILELDDFTATHRVIVMDKKGKLLTDTAISGAVSAVSVAERRAFLLANGEILAVSGRNGEIVSQKCDKGAVGLFAVDSKRVRVSYAGEAKLYTIE